MPDLVIRECRAADSEALCELVGSIAMGDRIRIVFDRSPDYFTGTAVQAQSPMTIGCFRNDGRAVGVFTLGFREVLVGGQKQLIYYLSDLRIHPEYRGGRLLFKGFAKLREIVGDDTFLQTLILEDNVAALKLLTSRRANLPSYHPAGRYQTFFVPTGKLPVSEASDLIVRPARRDDLPAMQFLYDEEAPKRSFSPVYDFSAIGIDTYFAGLKLADFLLAFSDGKLVGMIGLWDQSAFKRIRVDAYSQLIAWTRPVTNYFSGVRLPRVGGTISTFSGTACAIRQNDPTILNLLLRTAVSHLPKGKLIVLGFDERDPLVDGLHGLRARSEFGRHFLVSFEKTPPLESDLFAFDAARI